MRPNQNHEDHWSSQNNLAPTLTMAESIREEVRKEILRMFRDRICGKKKPTDLSHMGSEGHWLERQFGIRANSYVDADYRGFELKSDSRMVTLGDWSADEYIYSRVAPLLMEANGARHLYMEKNEFIRTFGIPNNKYGGRFGWAGHATPRYNEWNRCGQVLIVCPQSGNVYAVYSHKKDQRVTAPTVPDVFKMGYVCIAVWYADSLRNRVDRKWNKCGFFQVRKNTRGEYASVTFGKPFSLEYFLDGIKKKRIIFDSGMVENNSRQRNCSKFRVTGTGPFMTALKDGEYT